MLITVSQNTESKMQKNNFKKLKIKFFYLIYCDAKLNFQHHYSSLQCHMNHDPSETITELSYYQC